MIHKGTGKILSFGELLLRMCPDIEGDWINKNMLPFYIGGAELNVATALARWELPSKYCTVLPGNGMSFQLVNHLKKLQIDTSSIFFQGNRLGLFYLTRGQDMKHDALIYDRANSAFAELKTGTIDWNHVLEDVSWFHFSAICPAISQNAAAICLEALQAASSKNITLSVDLNYRSALWNYGEEPMHVMTKLVKFCHVIMGNIWSANTLLNIPISAGLSEVGQKNDYLAQSEQTSLAIMEQFPKCRAMANTFRFSSGNELKYYATLYTDQLYISTEYHSKHIIDQVGSGDSFMAGLINGCYNNWLPDKTLEFATASAFNKLFIPGDATTLDAEEIQAML
ncbi:MAG: PfkB family carbohydrate kinase [Mucilaginibacter sp.]